MIVDGYLTLAGAISGNTFAGQTVTGASPVVSTDKVDLSQARDIGEGEELYLRSQVVTTFTGLTALEFQAVIADDANIGTNVEVIASTGPIPVAQLLAGARFACRLSPRLRDKGRRYLAGRFVPTGTGTAGAVVADIGLEVQDGGKFYPAGSTII